MRKPSLSFDTFVAALAVLNVGALSASVGCSKAERQGVSAEPAGQDRAAAPSPPPPSLAPASSAVEPAATAAATATATAVATPPAPQKTGSVTATAVDAGIIGTKKASADAGGAMACGAGVCSDDMKKGN